VKRASAELFSPKNASAKARFFFQQKELNGKVDVKGRICDICAGRGDRCRPTSQVVLQIYEYGDTRDGCTRLGGHYVVGAGVSVLGRSAYYSTARCVHVWCILQKKHARIGEDASGLVSHNGDIPAPLLASEDRTINFRGCCVTSFNCHWNMQIFPSPPLSSSPSPSDSVLSRSSGRTRWWGAAWPS